VTRRLTYVTGTRADFGVTLPALRRLAATPGLSLDLVVTGMHLSDRFGRTEREVEQSGLAIAARIALPIDDDSAEGMARCAGRMADAMAAHLAGHRPDALLVLGDRSEMLAAALPAMLAGIPVVHIAGGERSGSVDDSMRHALSKLAHVHLVANADAEARLAAMGEEPWRIHRVGALGLVGLTELADVPRSALAARYGFDADAPFVLMLFHPVVQDAALAGDQVAALLGALGDRRIQTLCLLPNADHGTGQIRAAIAAAAERGAVSAVDHMPRADYLSALANAALLIGNSSSGIVEAASFGTPTVNVGDRQEGRARNANTFDAEPDRAAISAAIAQALAWPRAPAANVYGDGRADLYVAEILSGLDLADPALLKKRLTY
jgi:GDP/UDP-N,N'-diacetylbacillosamine 2-epimerase (hydrolysing)